jgi:hypothetical protein
LLTSEDDRGEAEGASYAAYNEAVRAAYKALADLITEYFEEHPELYNKEVLDVPVNFRPLRDFERTLRIQKLTLHLAIRAAERSQHRARSSTGPSDQANGRGRVPLVLGLPATEGPSL